jgi:hypothetical protein
MYRPSELTRNSLQRSARGMFSGMCREATSSNGQGKASEPSSPKVEREPNEEYCDDTVAPCLLQLQF